jgi:hypothetical protein
MLKTKPEIKKGEQQVRNNVTEKDEKAWEETEGGGLWEEEEQHQPFVMLCSSERTSHFGGMYHFHLLR